MMETIMGLYRDYIGYILGYYIGVNIGIMEKKMETTGHISCNVSCCTSQSVLLLLLNHIRIVVSAVIVMIYDLIF